MKNVTSKMVRKLYVNQVIMSVFGIIVISSASLFMEGYAFTVLASLLAAGLYLFIIYDAMWNAGAKDAAKTLRAEDAELEKIKTPFYIVLFASAFNLIGACVYLILKTVIYAQELTEGALVLIGDAVHLIMGYANGVYIGFETMLFPHPHTGFTGEEIMEYVAQYGEPAPMFTGAFFYFLIPIPLFVTGILAYYIGASETKLIKILGFKSENR